jgi:NAD(P)-dependent dehydrogenase (short-subunit alcohol dehydrogenase family)
MPDQAMFSLDGRLAIIGGGSGAIGLAAAEALVAAGASVILCGRDTAKLEAARATLPAGATVILESGDVTEQADMERLSSKAQSLGGVDILVNSVGVQRRRPVLEATYDDLEYVYGVNMGGVFRMTQTLLPQMVDKGYGKVINVCSIGSFMGLDGKTVYAISKGALAQYTRSSAVELARYGIRVNGVAPGYVDTPMTHTHIHGEREAEFLARIPLGRYAGVEDLQGAFVFLASRASDYMIGQLLVLDGGQTVW